MVWELQKRIAHPEGRTDCSEVWLTVVSFHVEEKPTEDDILECLDFSPCKNDSVRLIEILTEARVYFLEEKVK